MWRVIPSRGPKPFLGEQEHVSRHRQELQSECRRLQPLPSHHKAQSHRGRMATDRSRPSTVPCMPLGRGLQHSLAGWGHPDRMRAATAPAAHGGDNRRMEHCTGAFRGGSRSAWWRQHDNDMSAAPCCRGAALPALQAEGAPFWRNSAGFRAQGEALLLPCCPRGVADTRGACKAAENALQRSPKASFN